MHTNTCMSDAFFPPIRSLQPHSEEAEATGYHCHHSENPQGDSRQDHRQLQQEATATIQVCLTACLIFLFSRIKCLNCCLCIKTKKYGTL